MLYADGKRDRRTDTVQLILAFRSFAKTPENTQSEDRILEDYNSWHIWRVKCF